MSLKLLVVDDDWAVTDMLSTLLKLQGFEVATANRGTDCLAMVREKMPDLLLLDLMMPDMDGWAVCRELRLSSNVPILILSALNDPLKIASILDAGADDYLTKPVASSLLLARINRLLKRSGTGGLVSGKSQRLQLTGDTTPLTP